MPKDGVGEGIPVTYVPARNTIFLSLALGLAEASGARDIFIGVNALDYSGYPDCRPEFVAEFERLANLATKAGVEGERFTIHAPLLHMTKADIAREAQRLGLDAALSHSCYDPLPDGRHCGAVRRLPAARQGLRRGGDRGPDGLRMTYAVKECFLTLQGEGVQAGSRAVFLRFAGCNLWSGREQDRADGAVQLLRHRFRRHRRRGRRQVRQRRGARRRMSKRLWGAGEERRLVVITGGEPMLQLDAALIDALHARGFPRRGREQRHACRRRRGSTGSASARRRGPRSSSAAGDELKLVWPQDGIDPAELEGWDFDHFLVQPMDCDGARGGGARRRSRLAMERPNWRLSLQAHKVVGLP